MRKQKAIENTYNINTLDHQHLFLRYLNLDREMKKKNDELEQFNYATAHDMQEPLRTIISFIQLLKESYPDKLDETEKEYFSFIEDAAFRMKDQIDSISDYSIIGRNKKKSKVNLSILIEEVITKLKVKIKETKAEFKISDLPTINGFETELRLLFMNLITNAIKFVKQGEQPLISIDFLEGDLYWKFMVTDNGIGIEKKYHSKIFDIFYRLNDRSKYPGSGIGLAQVKKIVDLHNGSILVDSKLGVGSTFTISIEK